jgi:hypothetical protein
MFDRIISGLFCAVLFVASLLALLYGMLSMRAITEGVGMVAIAIWLAIVMRIVQAGAHHREAIERASARTETKARAVADT